ncbi:hypothetical protein VTJ04DRAFT_3268 [Mycothermus thermophilus]|uniref:uncharacterized protein n=1 Tax=Humicola insolens TaxID=85995 RepID=UPI003741F1E7
MFEALSKQTGLWELELSGRVFARAPETVHQDRREKLVQAITSLRELHTLVLAEVLQHDNLKCIIQSLPQLKNINLKVKDLNDHCLEALSGLICAQTIKIHSRSSTATAEATRRFLEAVAVNGSGKRFDQLFIWFRTFGLHEGFTKQDFIELKQFMKTRLGGDVKFTLTPRPF